MNRKDIPASEFSLEKRNAEDAMRWVRFRNRECKNELFSLPHFKQLKDELTQYYENNITLPIVHNGYVYIFLRNKNHIQGIWQRTLLADYFNSELEWEILLDLDHLSDKKNWEYLLKKFHNQTYVDGNWHWESAKFNVVKDKALVSLKPGGSSKTVTREFDLITKTLNFDETKEWFEYSIINIGEKLARGRIVGKLKLYDKEFEIWEDFIHYFKKNYYIIAVNDSATTKIALPEDAEIKAITDRYMLILLRHDWVNLNGPTFKAGSVIAINASHFVNKDGLLTIDSLKKKSLRPELVFEPKDACYVMVDSEKETFVVTENYVLVNMINNGCNDLYQFQRTRGRWCQERVPLPPTGEIIIQSTIPGTDQCFLIHSDFLTPATLYYYNAANQNLEVISSNAVFFNTENMEMRRLFAISADGTQIPYLMLANKNIELNRMNPVWMSAYGGFELSFPPKYTPEIGRWVEEGGVYVWAMIRGGGELGPLWHEAALKENRHKCFEDFEAVVHDLFAKEVTAPQYLGINGGSNGGYLVATILNRNPFLYGAMVATSPLTDMLALKKYKEEYGDPKDKNTEAFLLNHAPLYNITSADYPPCLFIASTEDSVVHPKHARRMVEIMRRMGKPVYYLEDEEAGHQLKSDYHHEASNRALKYTFFKKHLMDHAYELEAKPSHFGLFSTSLQLENSNESMDWEPSCTV